MAVRRIDGVIKRQDWEQVKDELLNYERDEADPGFELCEASREDWNRYVETENQELMSRAMSFENGRIYIVELPSGMHERFCRSIDEALFAATGTCSRYWQARGATYVASREKLEPDCSYGPTPAVGVVCPRDLSWLEYHTLKVEVGIARSWRCLDLKADKWRRLPGVQFILCVKMSPDLQVCQYKLHSVVDRAIALAPIAWMPIVNPTNVAFDSWRLLGLSRQTDPLPPGFAQPNEVIDLYALVQEMILNN